MFCKYFLPVCGMSLQSFNSILQREEVFNFDEVDLLIFYFINHIFYIISKKSLSNIVSQRSLLMFSSGCFIVLGFTF